MILAAILALAARQVDPPASQVLAENRLGMALWQDEQMKAIYLPYFDCYWTNVKGVPDAKLKIPASGAAVFADAHQACSVIRDDADRKADKYLATRNYAQSDIRSDTIARYRRQVGMMTLLQHYQDAGKTDLINGYLAQAGHAAHSKE